jgi:hypothetical protein
MLPQHIFIQYFLRPSSHLQRSRSAKVGIGTVIVCSFEHVILIIREKVNMTYSAIKIILQNRKGTSYYCSGVIAFRLKAQGAGLLELDLCKEGEMRRHRVCADACD